MGLHSNLTVILNCLLSVLFRQKLSFLPFFKKTVNIFFVLHERFYYLIHLLIYFLLLFFFLFIHFSKELPNAGGGRGR